MRIAFLGTRSFDSTHETSLGAVLDFGGTLILLDCGPYAVRGLSALGLHPEDINVVFVSHDHADHSGGFAWFVANWLLTGPKRASELVWSSPHKETAVGCHVRQAYPLPFAEHADRRILTRTGQFLYDGITFMPIPLEHTVETWGLHISKSGDPDSFLFLPDSLPVNLTQVQLPPSRAVLMSVMGPAAATAAANQFRFVTAPSAGETAHACGAETIFVQHMFDVSTWNTVDSEIREVFRGVPINPPILEWLSL